MKCECECLKGSLYFLEIRWYFIDYGALTMLYFSCTLDQKN